MNLSIVNYQKNLKQTNIKDKFIKFNRAVNSTSKEEMFENASSYVDKFDVKSFLNIEKKDNLFNKWNNIDNIEY